jgi:hypothetical protein
MAASSYPCDRCVASQQHFFVWGHAPGDSPPGIHIAGLQRKYAKTTIIALRSGAKHILLSTQGQHLSK